MHDAHMTVLLMSVWMILPSEYSKS